VAGKALASKNPQKVEGKKEKGKRKKIFNPREISGASS
jgi:hypothetical protein